MNMMSSFLKSIAAATLLTVCCTYSTTALAGHINANEIIKSTTYGDVIVGTASASKTVEINPKTGSFSDADVLNLLTFGVNHRHPDYHGDSMDVRVRYTISPYDASNTLGPLRTGSLEIFYRPNGVMDFRDKASFKFTNAYKFTFTIDSIIVDGVAKDTLPSHLYLEGNIDVLRWFNFTAQCTTAVSFASLGFEDLDCNTQNDHIKVTWPVVSGAEEYQLEWTFVNDYLNNPAGPYIANTAVPYNFQGNATRITTTQTYYRIPLLFEHGYVVFRLRAVGRNYLNPTEYVFSVWNTNESGMVNPAAGSNYVWIQTPHEAGLNWQATTTFAEEGKKKDVVGYYDGSLRNRQTVTQINTDTNIIVGETVYDHQGRPAINILPTPVDPLACTTQASQQTLHYYPEFNRNLAGQEYSRSDFDVDSVTTCNTGTAPLNPQYGSSKYYSPNNPNMDGAQGMVPDAHGYPFTRVEYTPDNTGRVRRQSGVGKEFRLGVDHETKYYYGKPHQIQLDRLFGSEVGYAAHYKKNLVIDPNGQVSVSYLDQEGRVVATALAGPAPYNLTAIDSSVLSANLTEDLLGKDINGNSEVNVINQEYDAIVFTSEMPVSYESAYTFNYDVHIDTLAAPCLAANVCFSCVYELEIAVIDECGTNLALVSGQPINKVIGHFNQSGPNVEFLTTCDSPISSTHNEAFNINLPVGSYTVQKILRIAPGAVDFYVGQYMDSTINTCFKTLYDFQSEYLANVDTSTCYVDCDDCLASLGDRDDYIASGKGTGLEYDLLAEQCGANCKVYSQCEVAFEMMLLDVSPAGQYGEYMNMTTGVVNPGNYPLSVLNTSNVLPVSSANWKNPSILINGTWHPYYLNEDGTRSRVYLEPSGTNYIPAVVNTAGTHVFLDATTNSYYTYPENLSAVTDFVAAWKSNWAKSLVKYHPEYCYYETCRSYSEKPTATDVRSSDEFDALLMETGTFAEAITNGFIKSNHATFGNPNLRVNDWFTFSSTLPYDPFVTSSATYGGYGANLQNNFSTFVTNGTTSYSMIELAAITVRCGTQYGVLPSNTCMNFGADLWVGGPAAYNDSIRNAEWLALRAFYLSRKKELQNNHMDSVALHVCERFNNCIGQGSDFDPVASGMFEFNSLWLSNSEFFNTDQTCHSGRYMLFAGKQKRFPDPEDVPQVSPQDAAYQLFLQTGECPVPFQLVNLLNALAQNDTLDGTDVPLIGYPAYTALYLAQHNFAPANPITAENWHWDATISGGGHVLTTNFTLGLNGTNDCSLQLDKTGTGITSWDDILGFVNLVPTGVNGLGQYTFTILARIPAPSTSTLPYTYKELTGYTTCFRLDSCIFPESCPPTAVSRDLQMIMTAVAANGDLLNTNIDLSSAPYDILMTSRLSHFFDPTGGTVALQWDYIGGNVFTITDNNSGSVLRLEIKNFNPAIALSSIAGFRNIRGAQESSFTIEALDSNGDVISTLRVVGTFTDSKGTRGVAFGHCDHPTPIACNEQEHQVRTDLERLLREKLLEVPFTGNINLWQSTTMTPLLQSYLPSSTTSSSSTYVEDTESGVNYDTLAFSMTGCDLTLTQSDTYTTPGLNMGNITAVNELRGYGVANAQGAYYDFMLFVTYTVGTTEYQDTLFGTSCWPIKNCDACPDTSISELDPLPGNPEMMMSMQSLQQQDSTELVQGKLRYDDTPDLYARYVAAVDSMNAINGAQPQDSAYVQPVSYLEYSSKGVKHVHESYVQHMVSFDSVIDARNTVAHPDSFVRHYGYGTNVQLEYQRYAAALSAYNIRAQAQSAAALSALSDTAFYQARVADSVYLYINYLKTQPVGNAGADDVLTYLGGRNALHTNTDSCAVLYQSYINTYMAFEAAQTVNATCGDYQQQAPLLAYEDFVKRGLCCDANGRSLFTSYIQTFTGNNCPQVAPTYTGCNSITSASYQKMITEENVYLPAGEESYSMMMSQEECYSHFITYRSRIDKYNISAYADSMNYYLDDSLYYDFQSFYRAGKCECVVAYNNYLKDYLGNPPNLALPLPMSIDEFCSDTADLPQDTCIHAYSTYLSAIERYNNYVIRNWDPSFQIEAIYTLEEFTAQELCYCIEYLLALVDAIEAGLYDSKPEEAYDKMHFRDACKERLLPPCEPSAVLDTLIMPTVPYHNPCVQFLINSALSNAQLAYEQYVDSLTTVIAGAYRAKCLGTVENFTTTFTDKEYHFTLYYYDQAGNLIKTVPPEGVGPLQITNTTSGVGLQIATDRANKTQTVFTQHRLATHYEYNSLNQLVRQSMPDQDDMDIWNTTLPNGLLSTLQITSTHFVNSNRGYLTGFVDIGTGVERGYVYITNDGGVTWQRTGNEVGADLHEIFWASSSVGYAVGDYGTILKTSDGGNNWDQLNTFGVTTTSSVNIQSHLNDCYFTSTTAGVVVGDGALMLRTSNGSSWTQLDLVAMGLNLTDNITSITYDGTQYYLTVQRSGGAGNPDIGLIYKLDASFTALTLQNQLSTTANLTAVSYYAASSAYACGADGTLLRTTNNGVKWNVVPTGTAGTFTDVVFRSVDEGVAIIETTPGTGSLYHTTDKGQTWNLIGAAGDDYVDLELYENSAWGVKVMAVGDNGLVNRVLLPSSGGAGVDVLSAPTTTSLYTSWVATVSSTPWVYVAGSNGTVYLSKNTGTSNVTWTSITTGTTNIKKLNGSVTGTGADPAISGSFVTTAGKLYGFFKANNSSSYSVSAFTAPVNASQNFSDITTSNTANNLLAYNNNDQKLYKIVLNNTAVTTSATVIGAGTGTAATLNRMAVWSGDVVLTGPAGAAEHVSYSIGGNTTTFTDRSKNLENVAYNTIRYSGTQRYAAGADGAMVQYVSGNHWQVLVSGTAQNVNSMSWYGTTDVTVAGDNGTLISYAVSGSTLTPTVHATPNSEHLYDVERSGNSVYVAGANGTLLVSGNITTTAVSAAPVSTAGDLYTVAFIPSTTQAYAMGEHAHVRRCFGATTMVQKQVYTHGLRAVHFSDAMNGIVVGNLFTARYTQDGGQTWQVITTTTPNTVLGGNVPQLNRCYLKANGTGFIGGTTGHLSTVSSAAVATTITLSGMSGNAQVNGFDFTDANRGVFVGRNSSSEAIAYTTTNGGTTWTQAGTTVAGVALRSVKAFYRNSTFQFIAVGTQKTIRYWDGTTYNTAITTVPGTVPAGTAFNDIYFHDDLNGYIVGTNGAIIKSSNFAYNQTTGLYTTGSWVDKSAADNLNNQTTVTNITISTVYFPNRYHGFIGGSYNNTVQTTAWRSYARVLNDESGIFSTKFYYDKLGRIVLSQNSRQYNGATKKYSYTTYDALGRVSEAGEKTENSSGTAFQSVFGTMVSTYYNPQVIDDANLNSWITGSGARKEVTKTYYDYSNTAIAANLPGSFTPTHLRKRVAHVTYEETFDNNDATYDAASHYTYDIHGNVNTLLQENNNTGVTGQDIKRIDYTYDLISGNVHEVKYQSGFADGMIHKYRYDADNRITHVYTSTDGVHEDLDAKYFYYAHGPLARTELGNEKVQGVDYVYTLHGWIKGVNSNTLDSTRDVGRDGNPIANNPNAGFAPDVFGYTLNYYDTVGISDYRPIDAANRWNTVTTRFESDKTGSDALAARKNLWNGNIGMMVTAIQNPSTYATLPQAMSYEYDQLNRLKVAKGFVNLNMATNTWQNGSTYSNRYLNQFTYDANGNILTQVRHAENGTQIENLSYKYERDANGRLLRNRLYHVNETVSAGAFTDDIDDQGVFSTTNINTSNNYGYDEEGRLVRDDAEDIAQIKWTVTSKVKEVIRSNGSPKKNLKFDYDASGKRIAKHVYNSSNVWEKSSYYTYDATGNVMAVYEKVSTDPDDPSMITYHVIERHMYGSARIGMNTAKAELSAATALPDTGNYVHLIGKKQFELSNHLGNVLSSISDKLIAKDWNNDNTVDSYKAEILSATDYTPFGVAMDGRTFTADKARYGFNGKEKDDEWNVDGGSYDFGARMYDSRLGRWLSVDPLNAYYASFSSYIYSINSPIMCADEGGEWVDVKTTRYYKDKNGQLQVKKAYQIWKATVKIDRQVYIHNAKLYNATDKVFTKEQMERAAKKMERDIENAWETKSPDNDDYLPIGKPIRGNPSESVEMRIGITFVGGIEVIDNLDNVNANAGKPDNLYVIEKDDKMNEYGGNALAYTFGNGGNLVFIRGSVAVKELGLNVPSDVPLESLRYKSTIPHEFGHQGGVTKALKHLGTANGQLMIAGGYPDATKTDVTANAYEKRRLFRSGASKNNGFSQSTHYKDLLKRSKK